MGSGSGMAALVCVGDRQFSRRRRARANARGCPAIASFLRAPRLAVGPELLEHDVHLGVGERRGLADRQRAPVDLGERFDLDRERERSRAAKRRRRSSRGGRAGTRGVRRARRARGRTAPACRTSRTARSGCRGRRPPRPCSGTRECRANGTRAWWRTARACARRRSRPAARDRCRDGSAIRTTAAASPRASPSSVTGTMSSGAVSVVGEPGRRHEEAVEAGAARAAR